MIRRYAGFTVSALLLAAGLAAAPAAAAPAPSNPDPATLAAGTEKDPQTGKNRSHLVGQGQDVPALLGVTNRGEAPVEGLVLNVRILNDLDFTKKYDNCWYADYTNQESAWCEFGDSLAAGASLGVTGLGIATKADARAENISSIIYMWFSKAYADERGGIQALAQGAAGPGTQAAQGTETPLSLSTPSGELGGIGGPLGFIGVKLLTPTGQPTATPAPTATTTAPAPGGAAGGEGGGLPVTGAGTAAAAGLGGVLLLAGGVAFLIARRRRTRFVA
ncbi:LPXTG cell wall anchor domain-containing protein [Phytohabitans houttuyneae]